MFWMNIPLVQAARDNHWVLHNIEADGAFCVLLLPEVVEYFFSEDLTGAVRPFRKTLYHGIDVDVSSCCRLYLLFSERR